MADLIGDEKTDRTLLETVEFIARKEQATLERTQVGVESDSVSAVKQSTPASSRKKCRNCQGESHGTDTFQVRREKCPAWDHKCSKCKAKGHYDKACYKCTDCDKWGHKSKSSRWCDAEGDKQATDDEVGFMLSAMTMQPRRRGRKRCSASKKELRQAAVGGLQRQGSNAKLGRGCKVDEDRKKSKQATVIGSINAWQQRAGRVNIPVPEREPRHVSYARQLRQVHTVDREQRHVSTVGKLRQDQSARDRHTPTKLSASKGCQTPNDYKDGNTKSPILPRHRGFNVELHERMNVVQDTFNDEEYNRDRETQVGDNNFVSENAKFSPLDYNGAILPPGYGRLGTKVNCHSTPVPVNAAATTSTVTMSTSTASVATKEWEHYKFWVPAPQVGQLDPIRFGSPVIQPTMWGTPLTLSQHEWPNLPTPLRKMVPTVQTNTTADALYVKESVSDAALENPDGQEIYEYDQMSGAVLPIPVKLDNSVLAHQEGEVNAEVHEAKGEVSDIFVARPEGRGVTEVDTVPVAREEEVHTAIVNVDSDASNVATQVDTVNNDAVDAVNDNNATTIAELECPYDNCKYVTGVGQDCAQYGMDMYAAKMEMEHELRVHIGGTHTENVAAARITASKGRNKSSGRPHGSKKRDKSRRWALQYEEGDEIC